MDKVTFMVMYWVCSILVSMGAGFGIGFLSSVGWGWLMFAVCISCILPLSLWVDKKVEL